MMDVTVTTLGRQVDHSTNVLCWQIGKAAGCDGQSTEPEFAKYAHSW